MPHYSDLNGKEEWQKDVYLLAASLAQGKAIRTVLDIGCGGAWKLLKYLGHLSVCGVEVEPTLSWLKQTYPDRLWRAPGDVHLKYDMVICSDVIEHVDNPTELLESIKSARPDIIVISTPERTCIPGAPPMGPPRNIHHRFEWTVSEFTALLGDHFQVDECYVITPEQATMVAVCRLRRD